MFLLVEVGTSNWAVTGYLGQLLGVHGDFERALHHATWLYEVFVVAGWEVW